MDSPRRRNIGGEEFRRESLLKKKTIRSRVRVKDVLQIDIISVRQNDRELSPLDRYERCSPGSRLCRQLSAGLQYFVLGLRGFKRFMVPSVLLKCAKSGAISCAISDFHSRESRARVYRVVGCLSVKMYMICIFLSETCTRFAPPAYLFSCVYRPREARTLHSGRFLFGVFGEHCTPSVKYCLLAIPLQISSIDFVHRL